MKESKHSRILSAALRLFVEKGFHGTSTSLIAREADIAAGTLFKYFKTKDDLVLAIYVAVKEELAGHLSTRTPDGTDTRAIMAAQFSGALTWSLENQTKFRFIQLFHTSPFITRLDQRVLHEFAEPHRKVIQRGVDSGAMRPLPVALIYALVSSQTFGLYQYLTLSSRTDAETSEIIKAIFEMLWEMLTPNHNLARQDTTFPGTAEP